MSVRGGMCRSPFGLRLVEGQPCSNRRLDKVEAITMILRANTPPQYAIFAEILLKSIHNYWYWGLGNNGCTDIKFQDAHEYLFTVRSENKETWGCREQKFTEDMPDGTRVRHIVQLNDEDMRLRCFDVHYKLLNLDQAIPLSGFLRKIEEKRRSIIEENREQVEAYFEDLRVREFSRLQIAGQMRVPYSNHDFVQTLSRPANLRQLEELCMFALPTVRPVKHTPMRKPHPTRPRKFSTAISSMYGRTLLEEAHVGNTDHDPGSLAGDVPPLQAA